MSDSTLNIIIKLVDKASAGAKSLVKNLKDTETSAKKSKTATEKLGDAAKKAATDAGGLNSVFGALKGALAGVGISMVVSKLFELGSACVDASSEVEEMRNKFDVVFGQSTREAESSLASFGDEVGRSTYSLMDMAASLQDTFVPLGFARDEAAKLSTEMTELAIDVASFNNVADADVMRDFQSAIVGNHETVRKYGIVITQTTLNQELMNMGIKDGVKAATEQEKVQARLNMIIAGTSDAHGDAARTSDSYANASRALEDATNDLQVAIGDNLLPVLGKLKKALADTVSETAKQITLQNMLGDATAKAAITGEEATRILNEARYGSLEYSEALEIVSDAFDEQIKMTNLSIEAADTWVGRYKEISSVTEEIATNYELLAEEEVKATETKDMMKAATEAEIISEKTYQAYLLASKDGVSLLSEAEMEAIETKLAYHEAAQKTAEITERVRNASAEATVSFYDLAESLKNATAADIAHAALSQLESDMLSGKIGWWDYKDAYLSMNEAFGFVSQEQLKAAETVMELTELARNEVVEYDNIGKAALLSAEGVNYLELSKQGLLNTFAQSPALLGDAEAAAYSYYDSVTPLGGLLNNLGIDQDIVADGTQNMLDVWSTSPESIGGYQSSLVDLNDLGLMPTVEATTELSNQQNIINESRIPRQMEQLGLLLSEGFTPLFESMEGSVREGGALFKFQKSMVDTGTKVDAVTKKVKALKAAIDALPTEKHIWIYVHTVQVGGGDGESQNMYAASGADYVVPPGYPNDTFGVGVSSGERVIVQTPAQQKSYNVTNNFSGGSEADIVGAMRRMEFLHG